MKRFLILTIAVLVIAMTLAACELPDLPIFNPTTTTTPTTPTTPTTTTTTPEPDPEPECDHVYDNACDATCNECEETREVGDHVYDNACDTTCNECGATREVGDHVYDNACDTTCNECEATREVGEHVYDNACDVDCNVCGDERTTAHVYDNDCDASCNECGETREVGEHAYDNACDTTCNECGETREVGDHEYDNACDTTCNECGETREVEDHVYTNACDATCNECGAERTPENHVYDNACDVDCNVCGETREVSEHVYENTCDTDCNECGATREITHTYDNACDTTCNVCGGGERTTEHQYEEEVTAPTCFAAGYTTHTCKECGNSYKDSETAQLTHVDGDDDEMCDNGCGTEMLKPRYTVTLNYGSKSKTVEVKEGETLTAEDLALDSKYPFALVEWQKDGVAYDTSTPVTEAIELTAVLASYKVFETPEAWKNTSKATSSEIDDTTNPDNKILQFVTTGTYNGIYSQNLDLYEDFADIRYIYLKVRSNVDTKITLRFFKENNAYASTYMQGGENITGNGKWQIVCVDLDSLTTFSKEAIKLVFIMSSVAATVEIDEIYFACEEIEIELPVDPIVEKHDFESSNNGWVTTASGKATVELVQTGALSGTQSLKVSTSAGYQGIMNTSLGNVDMESVNYIYITIKSNTGISNLELRIYADTTTSEYRTNALKATTVFEGSDYKVIRFDISNWDALGFKTNKFGKSDIKTMALLGLYGGTNLTIDDITFASEELTFE